MTRPADLLRPLVRAVPGYVPGDQPRPGRDVVKLNTNENPYPPSPAVRAALANAIDDRLRLYPESTAAVVRERAAELYGVSPDAVVVGNGSDELIGLLVRAVVEPGQAVAHASPTYTLYDTIVAQHGATVHEVPFPDDWTLPAAGLAAAGAPLTFVCNPNSPSGTLTPLPTLEGLARDLAGLLVVDEAYVDFAGTDAMALARRLPNVVVLRTLSKSYALAGLRVGLAVGPAELMAGLRALKDSYNVNRLSQAAAEAALGDQPYVRSMTEKIRATRSRLTEALEGLGYVVPPSQANFVLAVRPGVDQAPVAAALAARGVLVRHFATSRLFDALRITVGTDREIDRLLEALAEALP